MKKVLSVITALVIIFTFAACSNETAQENETSSKPTVTNDAGEITVGDDNSSTSAPDNNDSKDTTDANVQNGTTKADTTKKGETTSKGSKPTTEPTTVERKIKLNVTYPIHSNPDKTTVNIEYKKPKDKKFKSLFEKKVKNSKGKEETVIEKPEITLNKMQTISYTIDEELAGDIVLRFTLDGVKLFEDEFTINGRDSEISIELIANTEILDGGWD